MSAGAGTIGVRLAPRSRFGFRALILIAMIVLGVLATARILAADRVTDEPTRLQPAGTATVEERKPHGFGRTFEDQAPEAGVRNPARTPKS